MPDSEVAQGDEGRGIGESLDELAQPRRPRPTWRARARRRGVGFGWMGQVHARALQPAAPALSRRRRCDHGSSRSPTPMPVAATRPSTAYGVRAAVADWPELIARDDVDVVSVCGPNFVHREIGGRSRRGRQARLGREAGRTQSRRHRGDRRGRRRRRRAVGGRLQLPQRTGRRAGARARRVRRRSARSRRSSAHLLSDYAAHPDGALSWRFDPEFAGHRCARRPGEPRPRPRRVRRWATAPARSASWSPTRRPSSPSGPSRRRGRLALLDGDAAARVARSATRTRSRRSSASTSGARGVDRGVAGRRRRAVHATASRSAAPRVRSRGTSAGCRSSRSALGPGLRRTPPGRRGSSTPAGRRVWRVPARRRGSRWATTTSR